jgi:phosphoribosylanthranilate isomerase
VEEIRSKYPLLHFTGVFVNERAGVVRTIAERFQLDSLQFHGDEDAVYCSQFCSMFHVIKAIGVRSAIDFGQCENYRDSCSALLFDTAGAQRGGNGHAWDWSLLEFYNGQLPFFISGGLSPGDEVKLLSINHPGLIGADINSRFEDAPGKKNNVQIRKFISTIKSTDYAVRGE